MASNYCDSETETDPNDSSDEELNREFSNFRIGEEQTTGEWLPDHPWGSENKPDPNLKMKDTVAISSKYPTNADWNKNGKVDLAKIFSNLPTFVQCEMQGSIHGSRQELEQLVHNNYYNYKNPLPKDLSDLSPHTREIVNKIQCPDSKDRKSLPNGEYFKATSFAADCNYSPEAKNCFHLDCEYMLKMYVPTYMVA